MWPMIHRLAAVLLIDDQRKQACYCYLAPIITREVLFHPLRRTTTTISTVEHMTDEDVKIYNSPH